MDKTSDAFGYWDTNPLPVPVDWTEVFNSSIPEVSWLAEPLLAERRHISIHAAAKVGKSMLVVELAACLASGRPFLGQPVRKARVLYLDYENDEYVDVKPRLLAMGFNDHEIKDLFYVTRPHSLRLDTSVGGQGLLKMVEALSCDVVVIDTVGKSVDGEENSNDTWARFYLHTCVPLKKAGVSMIRIDHAGKDPSKGPRGGSAKLGDVDAPWRLSKKGNGLLVLSCTDHRMRLPTEKLTLRLVETPYLHHELVTAERPSFEQRATEIADALDNAGHSRNLTNRETQQVAKNMDIKMGNDLCAEVVRTRKARHAAGPHISGTDDVEDGFDADPDGEQVCDAPVEEPHWIDDPWEEEWEGGVPLGSEEHSWQFMSLTGPGTRPER